MIFPAATDPDSGDSITYTFTRENAASTSLPSEVTFDAATRKFTVAANADPATLTIKVIATDTSSAQAEKSFAFTIVDAGIDVDRPDPIELTRASQTVVMSVKLAGAPAGSGNGGVTLELETDPTTDVAIAPANLTFTRDNWDTAQKATVKLTPAALNTRSERAFKVKIGVSDAAGTDNYGDVATLTIAAAIDLVNRVPVIPALSTRVAVAGKENELVLKSATDAEGDAITYGVRTQPDWITGVEAGSNVTLTTATSIAKGTYTVTVTATDSEGGAADDQEFKLVVVEDYSMLDWNVANGKIAFTFNADVCSAINELSDGDIYFTMEDGSDSNNGLSDNIPSLTACSSASNSTSATDGLYGGTDVTANYEVVAGSVAQKRLTTSLPTPPASFGYVINSYFEYSTEQQQYDAPIDNYFELDYAVGHVTVTITEGAKTANTPLITLTLGSAISNPVWSVAATAEKGVGVSAVSGSETTEAVVALSGAETATYASDNDLFARLTILTRQTDRTADDQKGAETRVVIKVREVGDFQVDTGTAPALAANGAVAVFSFTGTGCDTTATYELEIPGSGMAKQTGLYCKTAVTDLSTGLPEGLAFDAAADRSLVLRITLSEFAGLAGKRITVRIHNTDGTDRTGGLAEAVLVPSVYVAYRDENLGKATTAANTPILTLSATGGTVNRYVLRNDDSNLFNVGRNSGIVALECSRQFQLREAEHLYAYPAGELYRFQQRRLRRAA